MTTGESSAHLTFTNRPLKAYSNRAPLFLTRSYKSFLPKAIRAHIQRYHIVTRKRIRYRFRRFVESLRCYKAPVTELMLKYVASLEVLQPGFYTERFLVSHPIHGMVTIVVTGNHGIQWTKAKDAGDGQVEDVLNSDSYDNKR